MFQKNKRIKLSKTEWRRLRDYVIKRDGKCVICGYGENLVPAHVIGKGCGGNDSPNNVVALCAVGPGMVEGCHVKFDSYEVDLPGSVYEMLASEPLYLDK